MIREQNTPTVTREQSQQAEQSDTGATELEIENDSAVAPGLLRFKHLAKKFKFDSNSERRQPSTGASCSTSDVKLIQTEIERYLSEISSGPTDIDALSFWSSRRSSYSLLAPLAEDLIASPASQAFVERIFSVSGWMTAARRNRLTKNLEMRVFMKLNMHNKLFA